MIEAPGIFLDMLECEYRRDPFPLPSLTQSIAKILLAKSPLHAWHAHPRLNPDFRPDDDTKFDVGNIAHKLLIGRGKEIELLEGFDDWRKKEAKEKREEAAMVGKIAVLGKHYALADRMVKAAREQLELRGLENLFADGHGHGEVCVAWQEGPIWLRQLIDWLSSDATIFADYKTTDMSAAPDGLGRMMSNMGWHIQASMGERGLDIVDPDNAGRRTFLFVVQETEKPYALNVVEVSEAWLTIGRQQLGRAVEMWADCMSTDRWPGYPSEVVMPDMPGWLEAQYLNSALDAVATRARYAAKPISYVDALRAG